MRPGCICGDDFSIAVGAPAPWRLRSLNFGTDAPIAVHRGSRPSSLVGIVESDDAWWFQ